MRDNERSHCSKPLLTRSAFFKKYSPCLKVYTDGFVIQQRAFILKGLENMADSKADFAAMLAAGCLSYRKGFNPGEAVTAREVSTKGNYMMHFKFT